MSAILFRPTLGQALTSVALVLVLGIYPFAAGVLLDKLGVQGLALLGLLSLCTGAGLRLLRRSVRWGALAAGLAPVAALLVLGLASGRSGYLLAFPALINLQLAVYCAHSLWAGPPLIERLARLLQPYLPDFTRGYCRSLTVLWCALFAFEAVLLGLAAAYGTLADWRLLAGPLYLATIGGVAAVEFCVRKLSFRYYEDNWLDRRLAAWFPAENTERGRRSAAYLVWAHERYLKRESDSTRSVAS